MSIEIANISESMDFVAEFCDVDAMGVVWHGNYVRYMEAARCRLFDKIGYGYLKMEEEGFAFPVIKMELKFVRSLRFSDKATITATLKSFRDIVKVDYCVKNSEGQIALKAQTQQVAVRWGNHQTLYQTPELFQKLVDNLIEREAKAH